MSVESETLLRIHRDMIRCRVFEDKHLELRDEGRTIVAWHHTRGAEGLCAVYSQLRDDDYCGYTHRIFYPWLCKGIPPSLLFAEACGKATGIARGRGGTHVADPSRGILGRSAMQGGHFSVLTGAAIAAQLRGTDQVAVITAGDGAMTSGIFHEAANHAMVWKLPVIFLCDNNGLSQTVPISALWPHPDIARIAGGYGMPAAIVPGSDPVAIAEAAASAILRARAGEGPTLIEVKLVRWGTHFTGEPDLLGYQDPDQISRSMDADDPIVNLERHLLQAGLIGDQTPSLVWTAAREEMEVAARFAIESPEPDAANALDGIYAGELN